MAGKCDAFSEHPSVGHKTSNAASAVERPWAPDPEFQSRTADAKLKDPLSQSLYRVWSVQVFCNRSNGQCKFQFELDPEACRCGLETFQKVHTASGTAQGFQVAYICRRSARVLATRGKWYVLRASEFRRILDSECSAMHVACEKPCMAMGTCRCYDPYLIAGKTSSIVPGIIQRVDS